MLGNRLEFSQFGHFNYFSVCRSLTPMDPANLPTPIATGLTTMYYFDSDVLDVLDRNLYYRVLVHRDDEVLISDEVMIKAQAIGDEHWDKVVTLLHFDSNLNDETGKTWTHTGAPITYVSVIPAHGEAAHIARSPETRLDCSHADFALGLADFTIEFWCKLDAVQNTALVVVSGLLIYTGDGAWLAYHTSAGNIINKLDSASINLAAAQGVHIALVRKTGVLSLYINGVLLSSAAASINLTNTSARIGYFNTSNPAGSYIDELRITKGVARYTENFTPPTAEFPNF